MPFNSDTAGIKHNSGMSKSDIDQGFERLDSGADNDVFKPSRQEPNNQGWRGKRELDDTFGIPLYDEATG
jgi:hypothetical protein